MNKDNSGKPHLRSKDFRATSRIIFRFKISINFYFSVNLVVKATAIEYQRYDVDRIFSSALTHKKTSVNRNRH